jgi:hypothetical protein
MNDLPIFVHRQHKQENPPMTLHALKRVMSFFAPALALLVLNTMLYAGDPMQGSPPAAEKQSMEDVIPYTMGNMRGHKMLYNEGWFLTTSTTRALDYAKERSFVSSRVALREVLAGYRKHTSDYGGSVKEGIQDSIKTGTDAIEMGTALSGEILESTQTHAKSELAYAQDSYKKAFAAFVQGNLSIVSRTEEERQELIGLPGNYYRTLKGDFSNIMELTAEARERFSGRIDANWEQAFQKAGSEFRAEYERSGRKHNSLTALGPILYGYLKSFYYGLAAPASKTIVKTTATGASYAVFLPISATTIVAGRTVQSVGLTVYYVGKAGVKIVSPTVESGLLSGMSLLSLSAVPVTYAAGGTLGAVNQVAFSTIGPVVAVTEAAASTTVNSAGYVGFLAYDSIKGTTRIVINQAASGIVLGYNALTAIPTHAIMGVGDVVMLAWEGPRLVIAAVSGALKSGDKADSEIYALDELPVNTVVDLKKLRQMEGVKVEVLSTDRAVIREVLQKIPCDARGQHEKCEP